MANKTQMLNSSDIISFVATRNPARARKFYQETLGLALVSDEPFAIVFDANGTMLRVAKVQELSPASHTVLGWKVQNIRAEIGELTKRGVRFERFDGMPQDDSGIWASPSGAKVAWFKDPDGNTLSLTQFP
jgi:catechol 2,3-dioxygenase-like lactoylglutathione lyase family enzyme